MRNLLITKLLIIILMTFVLLTCTDDIKLLEQNDKVIVSLSVNSDNSRSVLPQVSLENVTSFKLFGGKTGEDEILLLEFTKVQTNVTVQLMPGTWNFTLNAYNNNNEHILQGKILNRQISLTGTNNVNFSLAVLDNGVGNIQITFNFPINAGITQIKTNGSITDEVFNITNNGNFIFSKNGIAAGDYFVNFELYSGNTLRTIISEIVLIRSNLTSSKTITLVDDDLESTPITLMDVTANGNSTLTTNTLTLTFDQSINGLNSNDINLIGIYGIKKGTLSGSGPTYTLPVSGFTNSGSIAISVIKTGYSISGSPKTITIHFAPFNQWVTRVNFSGAEQTATVNLNNLYNNDIYLVRVNTSDSVVNAGNTGSIQNVSPILSNYEIMPNAITQPNNDLPIMGRPHDEQLLFPLPKPIAAESGFMSPVANFIAPVVGNTRNYWVESAYGNRNFLQKSAILRATGKHGNIWVMDSSITTTQAQELSARFDIIYPAVTNILGYEYGGKPGHAVPGGKDGDPKIQILVYDIGNNVGGYFWGKDYYTDAQLPTGWKSNNAEIFYISASLVNNSITYIYSTLAHEFQHMINFNVKEVEKSVSSPSWYNEMLSLMTEDVIAELINIPITNRYHIIQQRMPTFLDSYADEGVTEWSTLQSTSYAKGFAFGAYLLRNYGGADLLKRILANNTVGIDSITSALSEITSGLTFNDALLRYGEAMLYSNSIPSGILTYNKTVTNTINGTTYTAFAFDIWNMTRTGGGTGPVIYNLNQRALRPQSITLHSADTWKNKSGTYSVSLQRPTNPDIQLILMVK